MYAATVHAFWPRELNDWAQKPEGQVSAKESIMEMIIHITYPFPGRATTGS